MAAREVSPYVLFWNEFRENRIAVASLAVIAIVAATALLAPWIAPQDPYDIGKLVLMDARRPPGFVGSGEPTSVRSFCHCKGGT